MSEFTNEDRAEFAALAIDAYAERTRHESLASLSGERRDETVVDLLCDLRHYIDRFCESSWDGLDDSAERHYREERALESEDGEGTGLSGVYTGPAHYCPTLDGMERTGLAPDCPQCGVDSPTLVERLRLAGIDVEAERADPAALRATAADLAALALHIEAGVAS